MKVTINRGEDQVWVRVKEGGSELNDSLCVSFTQHTVTTHCGVSYRAVPALRHVGCLPPCSDLLAPFSFSLLLTVSFPPPLPPLYLFSIFFSSTRSFSIPSYCLTQVKMTFITEMEEDDTGTQRPIILCAFVACVLSS